MASRRSFVAALWPLLGACASSTIPDPVILSVEPAQPAWGWTDEDTAIVVTGENFAAAITPDVDRPEDSRVVGPSVFVESGAVVVLVVGTYLGPARFEGTIPAGTLPPGDYDVRLRNAGGGTAVMSQSLSMRAPAATVQVSTGTEIGGGTNFVDLTVRLVDVDGEDAPLRGASLSAPFVLASVSGTATIDPPAFDVAENAPGLATVRVSDAIAEPVTVSLDDVALAAAGLAQEAGLATFIHGTPTTVRLLDGAEADAADDFVDTVIRVEDDWGNVCATHLPFDASLSFGGPCGAGASASVNPVSILADTGEAPVRIYCSAGVLDVIVTFTEVTEQPSGYLPAGAATMDFF